MESDGSSSSPRPNPTDALARLAEHRLRARPTDALETYKLDSGVWVAVPPPRVLAEVWALPTLTAEAELYREGSAVILTRPRGSTEPPRPTDWARLEARLREALAALPERADAGLPYRDLRVFALEASGSLGLALGDYLRRVVKAVRALSPKWAPPKRTATRTGPPLSVAERVRAHREARRTAAERSAEAWCKGWLEEAEPGTRVPATELYAEAAEAIADWAEDDDGDRVPGSRTFYRVADRVIGPRRRYAGIRCYVAPALLAELVDTVEEITTQRKETRAA